MSPSRRPGSRRPRPARTPGAGSSRHPSGAPVRRDALDWTRAVFAGVEGVLLSWVLVLVPALIFYVVTAAAPSLGDASWQTAVRTATAAWLVGAGGTIETTAVGIAGGDETAVVISLVPLGLGLLTVLCLAWTSRRQGIRDLPTAAVTAATVVATHLALSFLAPVSGGRLRLTAGSLLIAALGLLLSRPGVLRRRRWPALVRDGAELATRALVPLAALGAVLVVVAAVLGRDEVADLHGAIAQDPMSHVGLALAQLAFLPDLVVWAVAFAAGPGFTVGTGTSFAFTEVVSAPLPAVPVLGGLPRPGDHALAWLVVPIVLIGVAVGAWTTRRRPRERRRDVLAPAGAGALGVALVVLVAALASSGSIGPGRMAEVGVNPLLTAAAVALEVGAGMVVAMLLVHHRTRATVRGWFSRTTPGADLAEEPRADGATHVSATDPEAADGAARAGEARGAEEGVAEAVTDDFTVDAPGADEDAASVTRDAEEVTVLGGDVGANGDNGDNGANGAGEDTADPEGERPEADADAVDTAGGATAPGTPIHPPPRTGPVAWIRRLRRG